MPELPMVGDEFAGYQLRGVLGRGGMSVVYQAENRRLGSDVALKVLAPELATDDAFRARFLEESRIAASLNHPNVIPIYDTGSSDGLLYIAMRFVSGTDMRQIVKKRGRLLPETALFLLGQAARALDAAHRKGLVHRDVKPGNLLIERGSDDDGDPDHVYLTDFGITKHIMSRSGLTSTGQFLGTIDYVAPEQIRGTSVDGQADQYSLGCVLYECLTGRVPFEKDLDAAIIFAHVEERPTAPSVLRPDLPLAVDEVFAQVLAKEPGDRYRSCREFIDAARGALGLPVTGPHTYEPVASVPAAAPVAAPAGRPRHGDTMAVIRPPAVQVPAVQALSAQAPPAPAGLPDGAPPSAGRSGPPRRWFGEPRWIALLTAVLLVAAGAGTWALVRGHSGGKPRASSSMPMSSMPGKPPAKPPAKPTGKKAATKAPTALMSALTLADESGAAKGLLPPATCKQQGATTVICTAPAPGISTVTFQTYPSLTALYAAYTAQVKSLNSGSFQANFHDCNDSQTYGEAAWNHMFKHPKTYSVAQMSAGMIADAQATGRVFCTFDHGQEGFVWTQDDGQLLGYVSGPVHEDVWNWWYAVHHNIGFSGTPMKM